jgi:hypothetical protein
MEAPSASNVCDPEFDERGPLLGEVIKLEKTIGDIDGQQRTIIKLELATLTGDEDPRCFKNVYRLQPLNHLHFSAAGRQSVTISQELDHANINSAGLSEHNAAVNESTKTTPPMNTQEAAPSTEQEETLSPKAGNMPPSSSLLGPPHGETQVSSSCTPPRDGIEAPSQPASLLVQNPSPLAQLERQKSLGPDSTLWEGLLLRSPLIRQPPTPAPPSRQLVFSSIAEGSRPLSASFEQPSSPALVATEGSPLRTYPPSPTLTVPKSPSPSSSLTVQQPPLPEKETPPSPSPSLTPHQPHSSERETPLIRAPSPTVRTPPSHLPSTRSSAASGGNDAHLAYLSPSPHQQIAPSLSPQTCKTPALAELEGSLQSSSLPNPPSQQGHAPDRTEGTISPLFTVPEDETSQAPLCPQQAVSPVECPIPASRPMTQLSPHFEAHLSFEALLATTPQQNSARITRSSQKRTVPPLVSEDTGFMDQTGYAELKGTKRKRGVSRKKDSVDQTKRTRNERNDDLSATGHIGAEQRCSDDGIEDPAVTMDALAKKFSAAIRLGGQVSQEPGGQTLPIHLTEPTRSHSTTLEALLEQQKAHAGALTSSATIANMTYQWCLIGGEYKSKFIGSSRWSNGRNEARLRRSGQWIICIVNHVYSGLRARVSAGGHGDGALDAYKIPAALAGEYPLRKTNRTKANVSQLHLVLTLMLSLSKARIETTPRRTAV